MCLSFIVISIPYFSGKLVIRCLIIARCIIVILHVYSIIWKFPKIIIIKLFKVGSYLAHQTYSYQLFTMLQSLKKKDIT